MNKETVSYIKHIVNSDFVRLDILNVLLAGSVVTLSLLAFITNNVTMFGAVFFFGAALAFFNAVKSIKKRSVLGTVVFIFTFLALIGAAFFVLHYLVD